MHFKKWQYRHFLSDCVYDFYITFSFQGSTFPSVQAAIWGLNDEGMRMGPQTAEPKTSVEKLTCRVQ